MSTSISNKTGKPLLIIKYILLGFLLFFIFKNIVKNISGPATTEDLVQQKWELIKLGDPASLQFLTPVEFKKTNLPLSEDIKELLQSMDSYTFKEGDNLSIEVNIAKFKDRDKLDLGGAANSWANELKNENEGFQSVQHVIQISGTKAIKQEGSFLKGKDAFAFSNIFVVRDNKLWQITIIHQSEDQNGLFLKNKLMNSLALL